MMIIPAIDIKNGKCVRLLQGRMDAETIFSNDPSAMGARWESEGAELIHVVDLDGAIDKRPVNLDVIRKIIDRVHVPIQVGGGIRDMETVRMYMAQGVSRVVIGTEAMKNPDLVKIACREFPERIVVGIDAKGRKVAIEGWTRTTDMAAVDLAKQFEGCGVAAINFTDIARDGMRTGPNIKEIQKLAVAISIPVVASGGVSSIEDIKHLAPLEAFGVAGVITGRAIYDGSLNLREAIKILDKKRF
ncbi:MAG: 1-(5-phosphoribosyl)-5-[(5-phosphoribosylamino)methylideneamino]imidazole-4-carboxamide isomerase [Desulfobacterales bacterium CG23_combo_of_CG06-09_8_20_14_all_51_8]|nr:MAG: 1-(5-phosphoribosyl)-5-[(5-phosphoribosylamino)methylideneamino]imidazole-4-carboxamide isomerase [Desulfobacterales bacterium CG23_combo_of_CG06-09_8_20_14_all_51_8]